MKTITVGNSYSAVSGLTSTEFSDLKDVLSYSVPIFTPGGRPRSRKVSLLGTRGLFPTGLLPYVQKFCTYRGGGALSDPRIRPTIGYNGLILQGAPIPYLWQEEAAVAALNADGRGIIVAPTGSGKSLLVALLLVKFQVPALIVVPSVELREQLTASLRTWLGDSLVGRTADRRFITVDNIDALDSKAAWGGQFLLIIDEFHHSAAYTYRKLNRGAWQDIYFRIGLTATNMRSQDHERLLLESILSTEIYRLTYKNAVAAECILPLEAYSIKAPEEKIKAASYDDAYKQLCRAPARHVELINIIQGLHETGKSTLVLVNHIDHGFRLHNDLKSFEVVSEFASGAEDRSRGFIREFSEGKLKTLVATGIVGEGVDCRAAEYLILAGGVGRSPVRIIQNCGRVLRKFADKKSGKVIIFRDFQHRYFKKHYEEFCKLLNKQYDLDIIELD